MGAQRELVAAGSYLPKDFWMAPTISSANSKERSSRPRMACCSMASCSRRRALTLRVLFGRRNTSRGSISNSRITASNTSNVGENFPRSRLEMVSADTPAANVRPRRLPSMRALPP